ncbi:hypothetical protein BDV24DRAFT_164647 [Aspergillus arachidicola]|uniref:Uncharacterized protein n=1 Tax=Aspergillus arachidicola TaxID=656916 RepID=A0A2G7FH33_9EURO|nr:hypothetical protein BDV24DRAFT_164647 [Aspergillus arachidicola]PIG79927.1 hypothetical protein AARAC_010344 [Aspergillus arachidicola]
MGISPEDIPEGWTNDPKQLERFFYPGSGEAHLAQCHGLRDIKLLLMGTPESGEMQYIIKSGGRYYSGDLMIDYIFEITKPKTFPAILRVLVTKGDTGLKYRKPKQVEAFVMEPREQGVVKEEEDPRLFVPYAPSESDK